MANPSIGLKIANGYFYPILNEKSEGKKKIVLTTIKDGQTSVQIDLYRKEDTERNEYVGSLRINHIKPAPAGEVEVELILGIDESGNLIASARDSSTGEYKTFSVSLEKLSGRDTFGGNPEYELESVADTNQLHPNPDGERAEPAQRPPLPPKPKPAPESPAPERKSNWRQPLQPEPELVRHREPRPEPPRQEPDRPEAVPRSREMPAAPVPPAAQERDAEPDRYDRESGRSSRFTAIEEDELPDSSRSGPVRPSRTRTDFDEDPEEHGTRKANPVLLILFVVLGLLFIGLIGYLLLLLFQGGGTPPLEAGRDGLIGPLRASLLFLSFRNR